MQQEVQLLNCEGPAGSGLQVHCWANNWTRLCVLCIKVILEPFMDVWSRSGSLWLHLQTQVLMKAISDQLSYNPEQHKQFVASNLLHKFSLLQTISEQVLMLSNVFVYLNYLQNIICKYLLALSYAQTDCC